MKIENHLPPYYPSYSIHPCCCSWWCSQLEVQPSDEIVKQKPKIVLCLENVPNVSSGALEYYNNNLLNSTTSEWNEEGRQAGSQSGEVPLHSMASLHSTSQQTTYTQHDFSNGKTFDGENLFIFKFYQKNLRATILNSLVYVLLGSHKSQPTSSLCSAHQTWRGWGGGVGWEILFWRDIMHWNERF